jgi:hypothetical protein
LAEKAGRRGPHTWLRASGALACLTGVTVIGLAFARPVGPPSAQGGVRATDVISPSVTATAGPGPRALPRSQPVRLTVARLKIRAQVTAAGQAPDGTVEVPPLNQPKAVNWYSPGPSPGEIGPAVLLGHVDSRSGPAVFYSIGLMRPGDLITVTRKDGNTARFAVDQVTTVPKDRFPTEKVYGDLTYPGLRLITCGGAFDPVKHSYRSNTIVYARLIDKAADTHESLRRAKRPT